MSRTRGGLGLVGFALLVASTSCEKAGGDPESQRTDDLPPADEAAELVSTEPILPLRASAAQDQALVALGSRLFHDPILSKDESVSCATCHDLSHGGDDGRARSVGVGGKHGGVNAPTVLNAALNIGQFWDGRAESLEAQIDGPVQNSLEMASDWSDVEKKLNGSAKYKTAFAEALHQSPTRQGVKQAIAAFERTLITVDAPFDRWLKGERDALSAEQLEGYELFKGAGCIACHQGRNVGGNMYQRFGVFGDYFKDRGNATEADNGRFNVTHKEADRHVFKVPSLRNVALTAPYFHDGSAKTLPDAVKVMAKYQLGKILSERQIQRLVSFLGSLTAPKQKYLASRSGGEQT